MGSATKVPLPCLRTTRPSLSSAPIAWRTVLRETSKVRQSSASEGSSAPGASVPAEMLRFIMLTSWEYSGMSLSMESLFKSTGLVSIGFPLMSLTRW